MTKHIIIDVANTVFRARHVVRGDDPRQKAGLALHVLLTSVRKAWRDFSGDHCVFCLEGDGRELWRKAFYAPYKRNRLQRVDQMTLADMADAEAFAEAFKSFVEFIDEGTNATVLRHPKLEADDLIAGWVQQHPNDDHVIMSSDSDFHQLISRNVVQFNPVNGQRFTLGGIFDEHGEPVIDKKTGEPKPLPDPEYLLFEKCIRGDPSDNIRFAYKGARKKGTKSTVGILEAYEDRHDKMFDWNSFMNHKWEDKPGDWRLVADDYARNRTLIDLTAQPEHIRTHIRRTIAEAKARPAVGQVGVRFLSFCGQWDLDRIGSEMVDFGRMFNSKFDDGESSIAEDET